MRAIPTIFDGEKILVPDELKGLKARSKILLIVDTSPSDDAYPNKGTHKWQDVVGRYSSGRTGAEIDAELRAMRDEWDD